MGYSAKQKKVKDKVFYKEQYKCRICGYIISKKEMPSGGLSCPVCRVDNKWDFEQKIEDDNCKAENIVSSSLEKSKHIMSYGEYVCKTCGHVCKLCKDELNNNKMVMEGMKCPVCYSTKWDFELKSENEKVIEKNVVVPSKEEVEKETSYGEYVCKICKYALSEKKMPVGGMRCPVCYSTKWSWKKSSKL